MPKPIYLDYAAATPMSASVIKAMQPYFADRFYNPSATYSAAQQIRKDLNTARAKVAQVFGAKPGEIVFTAGGTEANNLAIKGVMHLFPKSNLVVSSIEHESVLAPAKQYAHQVAHVKANGLVDLQHLALQINDQTVLVSIIYANNEVGTVQPLRQISKLIHDMRRQRQTTGNKLPLYFHTDAAQAPSYLDIHVHRLGVDMLSINGGKIYGPKQSGALYVKAGVRLQPQMMGGGQERNLRSGTENVAQIVGLATALDEVQNRREAETKRLKELQQHFIKQLQKIPGIIINGSLNHRLPNNVHVTFPGTDNERLIVQLDQQGILCAAGSACSASDETPSHVLQAMGVSESDAQSSLRFSLGRSTNKSDIDAAVRALQKLV